MKGIGNIPVFPHLHVSIFTIVNTKPILIYEKELKFDLNAHKNCESEELIKNKKFYIQKYDLKDVKDTYAHDFAFKVVLDKGEDSDPKHPKYKSLLLGDKGGICDNKYERCGLATNLMTVCFQDPDITRNGGLDANTEQQFENNVDKQKEAIDDCETIITLTQSSNPPGAGIAYTKAATKAGFKKVFTVTPGSTNMKLWMVAEVEKEYLKNPIGFIQQYGQQWFFCKCKKSSKCTIS